MAIFNSYVKLPEGSGFFWGHWMIKLFGSLEGRLREPPHPQDPSASAFHATVGQGSGVM